MSAGLVTEMSLAVPQFVIYLAAWFATIGGIWALFDRAETVAHPKIRERMSDWLTSKTPIQIANWPAMFASVFDRVFGEKHLSWKCFLRSAIVSALSVGIMSIVVTAIIGTSRWKALISPNPIGGVICFAGVVLCCNVLPDYVSLLETRLIIRFLSNARVLIHPVFLVVDAAFTAMIFGISLSLFDYAMKITMGVQQNDLISMVVGGATFWNDNHFSMLGIFLYSTFATTVWIWLFVVSGLVVRFLSALGLSIRKIGTIFNVKEKPLRSMGFVSMVLVTAGFVVLLLVQ